jgi:DNA-binding transcriptional ArsR family regulator
MIDEPPPTGAPMDAEQTEDRVFETVAELFGVLSAPIRLKIISAVCQQEKNVSELLAEIDTTQPNMSQHLSTLYRCGVLGKRREGTQIYYSLKNEFVATLCRTVCTQVAIDDGAAPGRLATRPAGRASAR